jgi:ribose transport system ATP-binding protein
MAILELRAIDKRFPGVVALEGVDFAVERGEVVALIGENGAGKSTLMKVLGGVHQPDAGTIFMDGRAVRIASTAEAARLGIGFVHQELNNLDNLDVGANLFLGREPRWGGPLMLINRGRIVKESRPYLERLGLEIDPRTPLARLSLAQQQMVEIARALAQNGRILILDEPTSSLTLTETERLLETVLELRRQGVSIVYITHRLGEVDRVADRVVALRDGRNAGTLERGQINHDAMVRLMIGRDIKSFYVPGRGDGGEVRLAVRGLRTRAHPGHAISLEIRAGEILGLAGLVGAGRSELAQALFGVDPPLGGEARLDGQLLDMRAPRRAIRAGLYLVPEDRRRTGLLTDMTVCENITLAAMWRYSTAALIRPRREREVAACFAKSLQIKTPSIETPVRNLSGGNQQKVVLAKWLSLAPKALIVDEPTRGIDVGAKAEVYRLLRDLAAAGVAVIVISSDMEEVLGISDRIAVMHEGALAGILPRSDCSEEAVMRLAVGKKLLPLPVRASEGSS